jgi:hypothetical protein
LALLVNDSEYNNFPSTQPVLGPSGIYLVSPGALLCASTPPRPLRGGGKVPQKKPKKKKNSWWRKNTEKTKKNKEKKARSAPGYIRWA